jgi:hypothetical protein
MQTRRDTKHDSGRVRNWSSKERLAREELCFGDTRETLKPPWVFEFGLCGARLQAGATQAFERRCVSQVRGSWPISTNCTVAARCILPGSRKSKQ